MTELAHTPSSPPSMFGRYVLYPAIARGGMATVHPARLVGAQGFSRLVAAKRLHPQFTDDPDFVAMFHDEARIASRIQHPNVVPVLDVVVTGNEVILVQEYVHGVPLNHLAKAARADGERVPVDVAVAILAGVLAGLHAAHEAKDELGEPLNVVHRDVSPQNVIVSVEGIPRLLDFGIAKARTSSHHTREGFFKGKIAYMAPEQMRMEPVTRRADVYATGVLAWELLVGRRFSTGKSDIELLASIVKGEIPTISEALAEDRPWIADDQWAAIVALEPIVMRALAGEPELRFATAAEMRDAVLGVCRPASEQAIADWARELGGEYLDSREKVLAQNEESWRSCSRIALSPAAGASGVSFATPAEAVILPTTAPTSMSAFTGTGASGVSTMGGPMSRVSPWAIVGGLLLVVGVLLGMLAVRARVDTPAAAAPPPPAAAALPSAPPVATTAAAAEPDPPESAQKHDGEAKAQARPVTFAPVRVPPRPVHVARSSPPPRAPSPPPQPSPAPAASSTTSSTSKTDCSPPFYFEGTKKVFKPGCL